MRRVLLTIAAIAAVFYVVWRGSGPQIDPLQVCTLNDLTPMALNCLTYYESDDRGWPYSRSERAYIRFLQDHDCRIAFQTDDDGKHFALVGLMDSLKIRKLYEEAKASGIEVPKSPFTTSMKE